VAFDRRVELSRPAQRRINRLGAGLALTAALAGGGAGLIAVHGDPVGRAERAWSSFANNGNTAGGYSHFTTLASNRADIWRVALHEFSLHSLTGIGQDNFATSYARLRHTYEQPRWVHSIELRLLAAAWWAAAALLGIGALVALAIPFIAARRVQRAIAVWPQQPALAYGELRSASGLMGFDAQIYLVGGAIALNLGEYGEARAWLVKAERREDQNWLTPFALGLMDGEQGRRAEGRAQLNRARRLNPRESVIVQALERLDSRRPLTFAEAQSLLSPHIVTPPA